MATIPDLWRQVVEAPDDIALRLVLADALIEQGETRGELIALQCRGADASMFVDRTVDSAAERVSELIADHWDEWLGPVAAILVRQGSAFTDGMLSVVQVGDAGTQRHKWGELAKHHELCALRRVHPYKIRPEEYAAFLAGLVNDPPSVEVHAPHITSLLRGMRPHWGIRHLRYGGPGWWTLDSRVYGILTRDFTDLAAVAPGLETLELQPIWEAGPEFADLAPKLSRLFPKLRTVKLETSYGGWLRDQEAQIRALGPLFEFV